MTDLRKALQDLFLEDIMEMSDEEIEAEIRARGGDPKKIAERMRKRVEELLTRAGLEVTRYDPGPADPRRCHECGERMGKDDTCPACGA
jgi:rubrerythrin